MAWSTVPLLFVLAGLTLYIILAGADFGAALWQVGAPPRVRAFAHDVMAPVWEANHVWLIFVLTITWTAYPEALGSLASTLGVGLSVALGGIVVRGAAYAVSAGTADAREARDVDGLSAVSSVVAPFALGACVGGIASGRVPYGNAEGDLLSSWLNPTSIAVGALAVAMSAHLAAVYLCDDARRRGEDDLVAPFRRRALASGAVAGALAIAGLAVVRADARPLFDRLVSGTALAAVVVSALAGAATLALVARGRPRPARWTVALAVGAVVAGWALAQRPEILPGLTVADAAASHDVLVAVVVAVVAGGAVLVPSLALLLRLALGGRLGYDHDEDDDATAPPDAAAHPLVARPAPAARLALACAAGGFGLLTVAETAWAHALGAVLLLAVVPAGLAASVPRLLQEPKRGTP